MRNMKSNIVCFLLLTLVWSACTWNKRETKNEVKGVETKEKIAPVSAEVVLGDDQLNALYQQYLLLSNALISADLTSAKEAAMAVELGAKNLKDGTKLVRIATEIVATNDLEVQRKLFAELSNEMIAKVKVTGLKSGEVYVEFCPMALDDKGASWLSNQKEIRNPYYGASMMDCGEIKAVLK